MTAITAEQPSLSPTVLEEVSRRAKERGVTPDELVTEALGLVDDYDSLQTPAYYEAIDESLAHADPANAMSYDEFRNRVEAKRDEIRARAK